jgi:hypothetical protein
MTLIDHFSFEAERSGRGYGFALLYSEGEMFAHICRHCWLICVHVFKSF